MVCTKMVEITVVIKNDINLKGHMECKRVLKGGTRCHMKYLITTRPCRGGAINMPSVCMMAQKYICVTSNQCNRVPLATLSHNTAENTWLHYNDVIMSAVASQITSLTIAYSTVYSGVDQRKHQSSVSLAFV